MLRWLFRLGFVGALVAGAIWFWSQLNQDIEDEELEDEIPIEFEVQMEPEEDVSAQSAEAGDTGVGPGADFTAAIAAVEEGGVSAEIDSALSSDEMADDVTTASVTAAEDAASSDDQSNETEQTNALSDLQGITGIGPVYEGRLLNAGVTSIADLATRSSDELLQLQFSATQADDWLHQAQQRTAEASE